MLNADAKMIRVRTEKQWRRRLFIMGLAVDADVTMVA